MRPVQTTITNLIRAGRVVMTYKTKPAADGGRQLVSVGPYKLATGDRKYAIIDHAGERFHVSAILAAKAFIDFVGRERAWEAARRAQART